MNRIKIDVEVPNIALPTILTSLISFTIWCAMFYVRWVWGYSWYITLIPSTLNIYRFYTIT